MDLHLDSPEEFLSRSVRIMRPAGRVLRARYSRFVGLMKIMLPAVAAALLGLIVLWPKIQAVGIDNASLSLAPGATSGVSTLVMQNPRYYGTDDHNQPFTVTAESAAQADAKTLSVTLARPQADFTQAGGVGVMIQAQQGLYAQKDDTLDLKGDIAVFLDNGYELHSPSAHIDLRSGMVTGSDQFSAQGPTGTLDGQGFRIVDKGGDVQCVGKCRVTLRAKGK